MWFLRLFAPCRVSFNVILLCLREIIRPVSFLSLICEVKVPRQVSYHMQTILIVCFMHLAEPLCVLSSVKGGGACFRLSLWGERGVFLVLADKACNNDTVWHVGPCHCYVSYHQYAWLPHLQVRTRRRKRHCQLR